MPHVHDIKHARGRYRPVTRVQCHTCMSPHRRKIERGLLNGDSPGRIVGRLLLADTRDEDGGDTLAGDAFGSR